MRGILLNNFGLKLFSFFMALLIWFSVRFSASYESLRTSGAFARSTTRELIRVPVQVLSSPNERWRGRVDPAEVDITVSGEPRLLRKLTTKDLVAFVTVLDERNSAVSTNQIQVHTPNGVTLFQATPPQVRVERLPP